MPFNPKWGKTARRSKHKRLADVYDAAADVIVERGHAINYLEDSLGRVCLWGAISQVVDGNPLAGSNKSRNMLMRLIRFTRGVDPVEWNNKEWRTQKQVVNMLRHAAKSMRLSA